VSGRASLAVVAPLWGALTAVLLLMALLLQAHPPRLPATLPLILAAGVVPLMVLQSVIRRLAAEEPDPGRRAAALRRRLAPWLIRFGLIAAGGLVLIWQGQAAGSLPGARDIARGLCEWAAATLFWTALFAGRAPGRRR